MTAFKCICADPPWSFGDKLPGKSRGAAKNYSVMSVADICGMARGKQDPKSYDPALARGDVAYFSPMTHLAMCGQKFRVADDCLLFLWRVSSQVEEAYRVVRAWGFVPKSEIVWQKLTVKGLPWFGMGRYVRASHETCIVAARGKAIPLIKSRSIRSTFEAVAGGHSEKPEAFFDLVEKLCEGPRLELFARRHRKNWTCVGDEL